MAKRNMQRRNSILQKYSIAAGRIIQKAGSLSRVAADKLTQLEILAVERIGPSKILDGQATEGDVEYFNIISSGSSLESIPVRVAMILKLCDKMDRIDGGASKMASSVHDDDYVKKYLASAILKMRAALAGINGFLDGFDEEFEKVKKALESKAE